MREIPSEVIKRASDGDMAAFEDIYKTFSSTVYTIALRITQNRQDAEEVVQDVFVKVYRSIRNFRFGSSFGTWLYRITVNSSIDIYHRSTARTKRTVSYDETPEDIGQKESPDAGMEKRNAAETIKQILKILSPEHRACIVLREIEGLDYKEMAEALAIPINTVRSRLKRAREALMDYCRKEDISYGL